MSKNWSQQQQDIFAWARNGEGNLVVRARAGTGKTTTIIEAIDHAKESSILLAAFNKRIAGELQMRVSTPGATAKTLHSVGFSIVRRFWRNVQLDGRRGERLAQAATGPEAPEEVVKLVAAIASLGKAVGSTDEIVLAQLAVSRDKEPTEDMEDMGFGLARMCAAASIAMELSLGQLDEEKGSPVCDFDDMVWIPVANKWVLPQYGLVVVDEAQDMNPTQLELAMSSARLRVCVVGDDRQAIYGFRGAKTNAIDWMKGLLNAQEIGLTTTYRCATSIVTLAQALVPDFTAGASNPVGLIAETTPARMLEIADPGDFILSRTNAPLAETCLSLLRSGKRARIEGKDMGAHLIKIVKERKARTVEELEQKLERWAEKQIEKLKAKASLLKEEAIAKAQSIRDRVDTILELMDGLATVPEVVARIESLFSDSEDSHIPAIVCSTIHKAKGLETDRVFILQKTLYPGGDKTRIEEQNLEYVAITRAKLALYRVVDSIPGKPAT